MLSGVYTHTVCTLRRRIRSITTNVAGQVRRVKHVECYGQNVVIDGAEAVPHLMRHWARQRGRGGHRQG